MTERELVRAAARRLAIIRHAQEVTGNVALTCRYYGISRHTYYIWLRRYEEGGIDGMRERSRRPLTSPNATTGCRAHSATRATSTDGSATRSPSPDTACRST